MSSIGFIGFGRMAKAIWAGIEAESLYPRHKVFFCVRSSQKRDAIVAQYHFSPVDLDYLLTHSDTLMLCIKPQGIAAFLQALPVTNLEGKLVISIMAGVSIGALEPYFSQASLIRAMPNTPAKLKQGITALSCNENVTLAQKQLATRLFKHCGAVVDVEESTMNAVTALSGSGPAFIYKIADILAKTGQTEGLDYPTALHLVAQTFIGAGHMLIATPSPQHLIEEVCSAGGTTEAGLKVLQLSSIEADLKRVILAAIHRAKELSL